MFSQGDPVDGLYYIKEGSLKLVRITEAGEEVIVQIVGYGEIIGETALFREGAISPISAIVMEEALVHISQQIMLEEKMLLNL